MAASGTLAIALSLVVAGCGAKEDPVGGSTSSDSSEGNVAGTPDVGATTPQGSGVRGRVTDASGGPIELATLTFAPQTGSGPVTQEANVTDADGRYFLPLPVGEWTVTVTAVGFRPSTLRVQVSERKQLVRDVVMKPSTG